MAELSFEEFGGAPAASPATPADLSFDDFAGERRGFAANIKSPGEALKDNALLHLYQAYKKGVFDKPLRELVPEAPPAAGQYLETSGGAVTGLRYQRKPPKPPGTALQDLVTAARKDPGKFAAEFVNSLMADPELLAIPGGIGALSKLGTLGKVAGGATAGGGTNAAIEAARQLKEQGFISTEELGPAAELGALLGGPTAALLGRAKPRSVAGKPRVAEPEIVVHEPTMDTATQVNTLLGIERTPAREARLAARRKDVKAAFRAEPDEADYFAFKAGERLATDEASRADLEAFNARREAHATEAVSQDAAGKEPVSAGIREHPTLGAVDEAVADARLKELAPELKDTDIQTLRQTPPELLKPELVDKLAQADKDAAMLVTLKDGRALTVDEARALGEGLKDQLGTADPRLLARLGFAAGGAATGALIDEEDPTSGALVGGLAGLGLPTAARVLKPSLLEAAKGVDADLGILSTRIKNISPAIAHRAREFERLVRLNTHLYIERGDAFLTKLNELPAAVQGPINRAILTNDGPRVRELLRATGDPELSTEYTNLRSGLSELGKKLREEGRFKEERADYYPRIVKDREGLLEALGREERTYIEEQIDKAERAAIKSGAQGLTPVQESRIINEALARRPPGYGQPGFAKSRVIEEITPELEPFYATPAESYHSYVRNAVQDLERAKFFGRNLSNVEKGGQTYINVDESIGNIVREQLNAGKMSRQDVKELETILKARFASGWATSGLVQDLKNLANVGLLGNIVSAASQFGDIGTAVYANGLRPTLQAVTEKLTGRMGLDMRDFGLADHISEEFVSTRKSAEFLNKMFKYSGFAAVDKFGKDIALNASLHKYERLAQSERGVEQIARKYSEGFGPEFPALVDDLRAGQVTDRVQALLFSELSDIQPITKLEVPQKYLEMPNGRIVYMLKTFMLKQLDIVRRDVYNEIKAGNRAKGVANLTRYALLLGISGATTQAVQDWLMGRDAKIEAGDVAQNILKTFGWSQYAVEKAQRGRLLEAVAGIIAPPYRMIDDVIRRDPKAVQYIPLVGKLYYSHFMGGKDKPRNAEEREAKRGQPPTEVEMERRVQRALEQER